MATNVGTYTMVRVQFIVLAIYSFGWIDWSLWMLWLPTFIGVCMHLFVVAVDVSAETEKDNG